jgi:hypothetical protein
MSYDNKIEGKKLEEIKKEKKKKKQLSLSAKNKPASLF